MRITIYVIAFTWHLTGCGKAQTTVGSLCEEDVAGTCFKNAVETIAPSGCNWNIIMPYLSECVEKYVSGCSSISISQWQSLLTQFNTTLQSGLCTSTCPFPQASYVNMIQCFQVTDQYTLDDVVANLLNSPTLSNSNCNLLQYAIACLSSSTSGCSALQDIAYQRLSMMNASQATALCNVTTFKKPTTLSPLPIFVSTTPSISAVSTTNGGVVIIGDGTNNTLSTSWIVLIVLGGALILLIIFITFYISKHIFTNNKARRQLLLTSEPSTPTENVEPNRGWRYLQSKYLANQKSEVGWPVTQSSGITNTLYRRDFLN